MERREIDAGAVARPHHASPTSSQPDEAGNASEPSYGREILAAEVDERVAMRARLFVIVFVGGEVREMVGKPAGRRAALGLAQTVDQRGDGRTGREALSVRDAERHTAPGEGRLEERRLRVRAEQHRHSLPRHAGSERAPTAIGDRGRFGVGGRRRRRSSAGAIGSHRTRRPASRVRGRAERDLGERDHGRAAAVVVRQRDGLAAEDLGELAER